MRDDDVSRRSVLGLIGAGGLALAGCSDRQPQTSTPAGKAAVDLPGFRPYAKVKPDLPATEAGLMAAYYGYPKDPVAAFAEPRGAGAGTVEFLTNMFNPTPPGVEGNAYWQAINAALGAEVRLTMTPAADYGAKVSTVVASGQLPDALLISSTLPNRSQVLTRLCADLSEFVSGDAVGEYPFLANLPTASWSQCVYGDGIYAVPISRSVAGTIMFARTDLIEAKGLNAEPASFAEWAELLKGLTDPRKNTWALGNFRSVITYIGSMLKMPNQWRLDGGTLTSEYETEERKEAIARTAELMKAGYFHPDTLGGRLQLRELFGNGTLALNPDGYAAWDILYDTYPGIEVGGILEPGFEGGAGVHRSGPPAFALTALKKAEPDRIRQVLRVLDWLAAPLGTKEYLLRKFGVEGQHYDWVDGVPKRTDLGITEVKLPLEYLTDSPHVLGPSTKDRVTRQRGYHEKAIALLQTNPCEALSSDTSINKSAEITKLISSAESDILAGRKPIDHWDDVVAEWRTTAGDKIRSEYLEQLGNR